MSKYIEGVKFITNNEMSFIDTQRKNHPFINWYTDDRQKQVKPSQSWFSKNFQWLRAVCTDNRYGLICVDCAEYARDKTLIERNKGAFVVRPYWKLKHKGLDGIKNHQNSDLHRASREKRIATKIVATNGNIIGQLNCVNLENQTKKYWSHEATSEWLISINNYTNLQQISSLKRTEFINLIIDETTDITVKKMICICLRYVEKDTGMIKEEIFKLGPIRDTSGEGIFYVVEDFINNLQKQTGNELIITAQTYDGAACMRFQAQGHIRSRLSAWGFYIYCRSHLLNLGVKDAIEYSFYDAFDTIKSALIYLNDSPYRIEILFNSQKATGSRHSIPKPSETRWSYSFEIVRFACQHYSAIIMTFTTISQAKSVGSSDGRRYVMDLMKPLIVFQIHLLRDVLRPAMKFLRQIEKRGLCLDEFAVNVDAARATISQAMNTFDFITYKATLSNIKQYAPLTKLTSHSTRGQQQSANIDFDECELKTTGDEFVQNVLKSLDDRFNGEAKQMIQDLSTFSSPSKLSPGELISNSLIQKYTSPITYIHKGVDGKVYERTDQPLLNIKFLKDDVYAFLKIVENISSIPSILLRLAKLGSEQCPEWFRLYQILATFAVGSNEAERMFSTLRRIKSWLRNRLNDTTIEILLKLSSLDIQLTDHGIDFIVQDFIKNPGRAKSRNVTLFFESDQLKQKDDEF
ncbi:unnamed protein product [Rotaria magnacalcarata]|uniref:Zinc finger MYM-type protein 1-like n=1 Tax=Rotaria magnacalcarata TaxID=392030 RepID=A0A815UBN3_9BILA|nr:unnamed protein product [Rotaria magnacalcarata]CAF1514712.1 unnamed protein product [Rotaria magnacalcarata]CAF4081275.1 unnamed protein product [Rotaria magnacalcarata]CAF4104722.1 unnamed protein product [Rotaria magnacalcarata]CAF4138702.1 unnamed protein product [Rotaria magnacalcarata]